MAPFTIDGKTQLYGIIGNPVSHSFSPGMHTQGFHQLGINAIYLPFLQQESNLNRLLDAFLITGVQGFNVTVPFKEKIIPYLDMVEEQAMMIGSVNTVVYEDTQWKGSSTDGAGFLRSIEEHGIALTASEILLVGAGGSAKAIAVALVHSGISTLHIINRTTDKAQKLGSLCHQLNPNLKVRINQTHTQEYDLLVNCTSQGMSDNLCPVSDKLIKQSNFVADIIYNPKQTPLLKKAEQFNIPNCNGIGMLLYQGIVSFEKWTGRDAPIDIMRKSLLHSLNNR
ncbi:MAG: shikimate dehydrogenase [Proteobacteria bacterium]|nr:shikimate dehydrogenase [Pseudomonadota bacterium]